MDNVAISPITLGHSSNEVTMAGFTQDFSNGDIRSGNGGDGARGGDIGSHNISGNSNTVNNVNITFTGPQIIVNAKGIALDAETPDEASVISRLFHGGISQMWQFQEDGKGLFNLASDYTGKFVTLGPGDKQNPSLVTSYDPYPWKVSKSGEGFKLGVPDSDLAISIGATAKIAPSSDPNTQLYILENTPANQEAIRSGTFISSSRQTGQNDKAPSGVPEETEANGSHVNGKAQEGSAERTSSHGPKPGSQINITVNDLSGSGQAADVFKDIRNFFTSDGIKNLVICLGHHQIETPPRAPSSPDLYQDFAKDEIVSSHLTPSPWAEECIGFPTGYFRIRAAGSNHFNHYWSPLFFETHEDGNGLCLATLDHKGDKESQVFFVNSRGNLCCGRNGVEVDVIGNTVIISHNRPRTEPWPNPWSHPLPTFSYSLKTKLITVKFHVDPVVTDRWPHPQSEWRGKEFVLAARSAAVTRIPTFDSIAKWAPPSERTEERWTSRAGRSVPHYYNLAVEEKPVNFAAQDMNRMSWEIDSA